MRDLKDIKNWTKEDFAQAHRELWWKIAEMEIRGHTTIKGPKLDAIAEIFGRYSENYYSFVGCLQYAYNSCFACYYANHQPTLYNDPSRYICSKCFLSWPGNRYCGWYGSLYNQWIFETDYNIKAELAAQIANLPVRRFEEEM